MYANVCLIYCWKFYANRFFCQTNDWIATKLTHHGPHTGLHPGCAQGQGQGQMSRDMDIFVISRKLLILAGGYLDRHQTCTWWSPHGSAFRVSSGSRSRWKVTWYGHLWFHENRFFSQANGWNANAIKLAHDDDGPQNSLLQVCAQGQGHGQRSRDTDTFVLSLKSLLITGKWLERYQSCTWSLSRPWCAQGQGRGQRSRETWKDSSPKW